MRREWGHFLHGNKQTHPSCTQNRTVKFRPTPALQMPPIGVPASPWVWAKAGSKLGALIRPCGDGVVSNEARMGHFLHGNKQTHPSCTQNRTVKFRPTPALQMPPVGVPASPWVWAKAGSKLGALIRPCGDGVVSNEARMGHFTRKQTNSPLLHTEPDCFDPPLHSRRPPLAFPPRPGCGRRPEAN
jgi:hypothetical protein